MAQRPVFVPDPNQPGLVRTEMVSFIWHPGLSFVQKQRNVAALHAAAVMQLKLSGPPLEVSTKSTSELGVSLSAFNLTLPDIDGRDVPIECIFQSSKKFQMGGPFSDLRRAHPRAARGDPRLKNSGPLVCFDLDGEVWPLDPPPSFYDWLYLLALRRQASALSRIVAFPAFTDIEFNPEVSVNCQARSVALAVALGHELAAVETSGAFRTRFSLARNAPAPPTQLSLF